LFHKFIIIIALILSISCYVNNNPSQQMTTMVLTNLPCSDCKNEIEIMIDKIDGIHEYEIWMNNEKTVVLLNFKYNNNKIQINEISNKITSNGYSIELINSKE